MEARVLERAGMHSNLTVTQIWDAAKVTSELGLIYNFSVQAQSLLVFPLILWFNLIFLILPQVSCFIKTFSQIVSGIFIVPCDNLL